MDHAGGMVDFAKKFFFGSLSKAAAVYQPRSPWGPFAALAVAVSIFAACTFLMPLCIYAASSDFYLALSGRSRSPMLFQQSASPILQGLQQSAVAGLVILVSGMRGGTKSEVLSLRPTGILSSLTFAGLAFLAMVPIYFLISATISTYTLITDDFSPKAWLKPSWPWINLITSIIGAPISEEMLFRGFLLSALANSRLGFWPAAVASDLAWTLMHVLWAWPTLLSHFTFGLLLSLLISRTGSLWPCVIAHSINNTVPALFQLIYARS